MMKVHELKIKMVNFLEVQRGNKTFELRKNDRDFKEGDLVHFIVIGSQEAEMDGGFYKIDYVLKDVPEYEYGLDEGYCIFSIHKVGILDWRDKMQRKLILNSAYGKMMEEYNKKDCACWEDEKDAHK